MPFLRGERPRAEAALFAYSQPLAPCSFSPLLVLILRSKVSGGRPSAHAPLSPPLLEIRLPPMTSETRLPPLLQQPACWPNPGSDTQHNAVPEFTTQRRSSLGVFVVPSVKCFAVHTASQQSRPSFNPARMETARRHEVTPPPPPTSGQLSSLASQVASASFYVTKSASKERAELRGGSPLGAGAGCGLVLWISPQSGKSGKAFAYAGCPKSRRAGCRHLFLISCLIPLHNYSLLMDTPVFITCLNLCLVSKYKRDQSVSHFPKGRFTQCDQNNLVWEVERCPSATVVRREPT